MSETRKNIISQFYQNISKASKELTKKELFKDVLHRLYPNSTEISDIIDKMSLGSETAIFNIPRLDKMHRGSADTLYNNIIIEFENDLKKSEKHAKEQLAGYYLGQIKSGKGYNYTLIASDFITWKVYYPDVSQIHHLENLKEHELILHEIDHATFILNESNGDDFYYWIDRFLFKETKQKATLERIEDNFGYKSALFTECFRLIIHVFKDAKKYGEVQVSLEQWKKFLSIAYGKFEGSDEDFVIHTYLSILAKILTYEVLSNDDYIDEDEMKDILQGDAFHRYGIENFVESDFYHWVHGDRYFRELMPAFRLIANEVSKFDFERVDEDILKGVYQELIDLDTRHALGEYYTPDWLCERIVREFEFKKQSKILDPSCGSGSFLQAAIHRLKSLHADISSEEILKSIHGIDIHPLSVQIAKATVLISVGKIETGARNHLNIVLANTLLAPDGVQNLFGNEFKMKIDREELVLNTQILDDDNLFNVAIDFCEELAEYTQGKASEPIETLINTIRVRIGDKSWNGVISENFYKIYLALKKVKENERDSIWSFIIKNLYKPYFLAGKFDFIVGNPPWFTFSSIKNEEYQNILESLAETHQVKPDNAKNMPHLEIAAIFLSYCTSYFLKDEGKLAFVLPRSFFSADQHDNTRNGKAKDLRLTKIWDLNEVSPLFNIPSCVLFSEKSIRNNKLKKEGLKGVEFKGRLKKHNSGWDEAEDKISESKTNYFYSQQGKSSAFTLKQIKQTNKINPYKKLFNQGATIVPRTFYFIEAERGFEITSVSEPKVRTLKSIISDAKKPWKEISFSKIVNSKFIFLTAISRSILPFSIFKPDYVILPLKIENIKGKKKIILQNPKEIQKEGYSKAYKWFEDCGNIWNIHRTEKNKVNTSYDYLNWQNKLTSQNLNAPYLVLYNASAKDANATIVKRKDYDLEFIVESKAYVFYTDNINEAYYLTAILNSTLPNAMMKDFQSKGLFGARDVHKKILDVYFPQYDDTNKTHTQLALLGKEAHEKTKVFLENNPPQQELSAMHLGRLRLNIKKHLADEMVAIDEQVKKIIK
jgi:hypothetical protein